MAYLTEMDLRGFASAVQKSAAANNLRKSAALADVSIFLSHSHLDSALALGMVNLLATFGVTLYVDWNDTEMPRITSRATAEKIKDQIKSNDLFMILATRNAMASKWVPWEIGVADQCKGEGAIVLLPVDDPSGQHYGSEYLQLYSHVEGASVGGFGVFQPGQTRGAMLAEHVRKFT